MAYGYLGIQSVAQIKKSLFTYSAVRIINVSAQQSKNQLRNSEFNEVEGYEGRDMKTNTDLQTSSPVSVQFKECHLLHHQRIIKEFDNGDFLLSDYIDSPEQCFPYWNSHIIIISPQVWLNNLKERITAWCNVT